MLQGTNIFGDTDGKVVQAAEKLKEGLRNTDYDKVFVALRELQAIKVEAVKTLSNRWWFLSRLWMKERISGKSKSSNVRSCNKEGDYRTVKIVYCQIFKQKKSVIIKTLLDIVAD